MSSDGLARRLNQAIDAGLKQLAEAVDEQRASKEVQRHFELMAKFPQYSWRNGWMIEAQRPAATLVAGFRQWKRLGRRVRKGQKAIRILAPCPVRPAHVRGDQEDGRKDDQIVYFKAACVFDVAQTEGRELATCTLPVVAGDASELLRRLEQAAKTHEIDVRYAALPDGVYGVSEGGRVRISSAYSTAQQAKTLAHELAHEWMHKRRTGAIDRTVRRTTKELEAEAVAYVVCRHFELDVELRASRYIALWGGDANAIAASFTRIGSTARKLIEAVEQVSERTVRVAA